MQCFYTAQGSFVCNHSNSIETFINRGPQRKFDTRNLKSCKNCTSIECQGGDKCKLKCQTCAKDGTDLTTNPTYCDTNKKSCVWPSQLTKTYPVNTNIINFEGQIMPDYEMQALLRQRAAQQAKYS